MPNPDEIFQKTVACPSRPVRPLNRGVKSHICPELRSKGDNNPKLPLEEQNPNGGFLVFLRTLFLLTFVYKPTVNAMKSPEHARPGTDEPFNQRLQTAMKNDRFKSWPATIALGGLIAIALRLAFGEFDAYIDVGSKSIYLWELGLFFLSLTIAFLPASLRDAVLAAEGKPLPSTSRYIRGILIRFVATILLIVLGFQFV